VGFAQATNPQAGEVSLYKYFKISISTILPGLKGRSTHIGCTGRRLCLPLAWHVGLHEQAEVVNVGIFSFLRTKAKKFWKESI